MDLTVRESGNAVNFEEYAMSVDNVVRQIELIQEVQRRVMKQGEHYGVIPGCGDKPSLLKPGAEKLGFTFRLAPEFEVTTIDHPGGHREYQVKCRLRHIPTGTMVGEGVGTCTTLEGKYRFRWDNTGEPVPAEYWKSRDKDLLGGPFNTTRKTDGSWFIFQRVEHDNPADYYNTCEKMAKKRAHVDAILTATAASDIFTQDVEDMTEVLTPKEETIVGSQSPLPGTAEKSAQRAGTTRRRHAFDHCPGDRRLPQGRGNRREALAALRHQGRKRRGLQDDERNARRHRHDRPEQGPPGQDFLPAG